MTATTSRVDFVTALMGVLDAYVLAKSSDIDTLQAAYSARPESFGDLPCAYLGTRREDIRMDVARFDRAMSVNVCLVDRVTDNVEAMARLDVCVDAVLGALQDGLRALQSSTYSTVPSPAPPIYSLRIESDELDIGGVPYRRETIEMRADFTRGSGL